MDQPPPLTPQEVAARQTAEYASIGQPQSVKIFGIMHLVLGAYGILVSIIAILVMFGINPVLALMPKNPANTAQIEQQAAMQAEMIPMSILTTAIAIATTVFIIIAGTLMLKRRRNGLKWSNRYAWTSLFGKMVNAGMVVFYTYPMIKETQTTPPMTGAMAGTFEIVLIGSMILGVLLTCLYPILALVFLNRPKTKEWFAAQPQ